MSTPTLMNPNPEPTRSAESLSPLDPKRIRVVDVESTSLGRVERFDCYDPGSEEKMFRLEGDEVHVWALRWARSADMEAEPVVRWTSTGLPFWEVDQIRVFTWPRGELIRVYRDVS